MKYAMVIFETADESEQPSEVERDFTALARWWADLKTQGKIVATARLGSTRPVTSVSWRGGQPMLTDGPYVEAKETVGGFAVLDVSGYAEAMEIMASFGFASRRGLRIEVRRIVET
jgi:hypothetical protein